jgi:hypothetical protein
MGFLGTLWISALTIPVTQPPDQARADCVSGETVHKLGININQIHLVVAL